MSYQDGIGEKGMVTSPFLHFHGHRYSGYNYDRAETQVRMYLNPPQEALPQLANEFVQVADQEQIPFYFKLIDFSLQRPTQEDLTRMDRMIFYTDKVNAAKIAQALDKIRQKHPDWFQDRPLPTMTAKITDGIGIAEEPSDFQNNQFSKVGENKVSFNWVRARFLKEVWRDTTRDIISQNPDIRPRGGRTLRKIFNDTIPVQDRAYVDQIWKSGFNPDALDDKGKRVLQDALLRTMADAMPNIQPESLSPYIDGQIQLNATRYGINPGNLAFNAAT